MTSACLAVLLRVSDLEGGDLFVTRHDLSVGVFHGWNIILTVLPVNETEDAVGFT